MQTLTVKIDELLAARSLLQHPFYVSWSEGTLTHAALAGYAKEYYQLVKAVPEYVGMMAEHAPTVLERSLRAHQAEEQAHVRLWESFAEYMGISAADLKAYKGLPKTQAAVSEMRTLYSSYAGGAAAMYAFEKALPAISKTKLDGLKRFYHIEDKAATTYFEVHAVVDIVHAQYWAELLAQQPSAAEAFLYAQATASLTGQHVLLDSCYEAYC